MSYYFFMSYARRDAVKNPWVDKFFEDLALQVGRSAKLKADTPEKEIGFFDQMAIAVGEQWPKALEDALKTTRVLVCLYSGSYFSSEGCGKELAAFEWRLKQKWGQAGKPPLILPVLWERPSDLQEKNKDLGTDYVQEGLEYLIRLERGAEYQTFLMAFGSRLVAVATQYQLNDSDSIPGVITISCV